MNTTVNETTVTKNINIPENLIDSISTNRPNLLQFLSNANSSLIEPTDSDKNIPQTCNNLYNVIESSTGVAKSTAMKELAQVYKQNSTTANGNQLSDEYINVIMELNFSANPVKLDSLIGIVGDAIFEPVYGSGFTNDNGFNLLNSLIKTSSENVQRWILNLTFKVNEDAIFKGSVNNAIEHGNNAELTLLLNTIDWNGAGTTENHQQYITSIVNFLETSRPVSFDKVKKMSLSFNIGEIAYVQLW